MRVPNITMYDTSRYNLGRNTSKLKDANEIMSSQKRINSMSDDPVGLSQVIDIKASVKNLEQIEKNVQVGKTWLTACETALDSVNNLILDAKTEVSRLINASATADERKDAVERIDNILELIVSLGNTKVNGNYVFSGTDTDTKPFVLHNDTDPPHVSYEGDNSPFAIKTDTGTVVEVGKNGGEVFEDDTVVIQSTNNTIVFKEDNGRGSAFEKTMTAVVPEGEYTAKELETAVRNVLNEASEASGYGVTYTVNYSSDEKKFTIKEDGSYAGFMRTSFLWESGGDAHISHIKTGAGVNPDGIDITVENKDALTIATPQPHGTDPFRLKWDGDENWLVQNNPGYVMPSIIAGTADRVDIDFNENGFSDITINLEHPVQQKGGYIEFEIIPETNDYSAGHEMEFEEDMVLSPPASDRDAVFITDIEINNGVNDAIDFTEVDAAGVSTSLTADLTAASDSYTDMDSLALTIENALETASAAGPNSIDYAVSYDPDTSRFNIREDGASLNELQLNWKTGPNSAASAASTLGYSPLDDVITYPHSSIRIDNTNNMIDFQEENPAGTFTPLQAAVRIGNYSDPSDLAAAVEGALDAATANGEDYTVNYDPLVPEFTITAGGAVTSFDLLWQSGANSALSIGEPLGFDGESDDTGLMTYSSDAPPVTMSLFSSVIDDSNNIIEFEEIDGGGVSTMLKADVPSGTYNSVSELGNAVESVMEKASDNDGNAVNYDVSYDEASNRFVISRSGGGPLNELKLLWSSGTASASSIGTTLGFGGADSTGATTYTGGSDPSWISFDSTNNKIDFKETGIDGTLSPELSVEIPPGDYTDPAVLASTIENAMQAVSANGVNYSVAYDDAYGFMIKGSSAEIKQIDLLWQTGGNAYNSAAEKLGFHSKTDDAIVFAESDQDVVNLTIDASNNKIDFMEITEVDGENREVALTADVATGSYTNHDSLAGEIEKAIEKESRINGNRIDYSVSFDKDTKKFTIKEAGTELKEFRLLWGSGENRPVLDGGTGQSMAPVLGFDQEDDIDLAGKSAQKVEWSLFNTLIDLKSDLDYNDVNGIERALGRLETHYDKMTASIVNTGMRYSRLDVREKMTQEVNLSITERRSMIEDADITEAIMNLEAAKNAYQASLSSTSRVINISLVDYL